MPVPKRKLSKSRRDMRSASKGIDPQVVQLCSNKACSEPTMPHAVCRACGFYRGEKVLQTKADRSVKRDTKVAARAKTAEKGSQGE